MKRSTELRSMSVEHHLGLIAARNLRQAAAGEAPLEEVVAGFLRVWETEIRPHFRAEEEVLLPELARAVPADDPLIVRVLTEHVALRRAVRDLAAAEGERLRELAGELGRALDDHIRFEERVLFPKIEELLAGPALAELARGILEAR